MLLLALSERSYGGRAEQKLGHGRLVALLAVTELVVLPLVGLLVDHLTRTHCVSLVTSLLPLDALAYLTLLH